MVTIKSIEEKAKRYDEALEKAEKIHNEHKAQPFNVMLKVFPELAESEDERIRKAIENVIRVYGKTQGEWIGGYDMDTLIIHLRKAFEKQDKQTPESKVEPKFKVGDWVVNKFGNIKHITKSVMNNNKNDERNAIIKLIILTILTIILFYNSLIS